MRALAQRFVRPSLRSARPMSTLVIAEHEGGALRPHTYATITAASQLPGEITVLVAGEGPNDGGYDETCDVWSMGVIACVARVARGAEGRRPKLSDPPSPSSRSLPHLSLALAGT